MSKALKAIIDKHYTAAQKLDEFQVEDVIFAVLTDDELKPSKADLVRMAVVGAVKAMDKTRTAQPKDGEPTLFATDHTIALGGSLRKRKGALRLEDVEKHMEIVRANRISVDTSADQEEDDYETLRPWLEEGLTWEQALAEYVAQAA